MTRDRFIKVRVTEAECTDWNRQAAADSTTVSELVRRRMSKRPATTLYRDDRSTRSVSAVPTSGAAGAKVVND